MIKRVSDLLEQLAAQEAQKLATFQLKHAPTIGAMYEGLTTDILHRTLPPELELDVVSGFVTNDTGELSPQIDCMIVHGSGEQVPYTSAYKWHVKDVVATVEVKKTLYSAEIADAYGKLRAIMDNFGRHAIVPGHALINSEHLLFLFRRVTGICLTDPAGVDALPYHLQLLFHTLAIEMASPVRIAIGYDGFISEPNIANAFLDHIAANVGAHGYGVMGMPQLCISGSHAIVKMNAQPYLASLYDGDWWPVLATSPANPLRLLVELIWTRLEDRFGVGMPWGEDADDEELTAFLAVRGIKHGEREGWEMKQLAFWPKK